MTVRWQNADPAIGDRFAEELHARIDLSEQQWWMSAAAPEVLGQRGPLFCDFDRVYGNGEFTWAGLWTATDPPSEAHHGLVSAWEIYPGPVTRWRLPVDERARVYEVHRPEDWVALVEAHPKRATRPHEGWELPGPNQHDDVGALVELANQRAASVRVSEHVLPDWASVAESFDAVRVSWAGFITTEGYVSEMRSSVYTMLRYWGSERTLWLSDVFGDPEPLEAPHLSGRIGGVLGADPRRDLQRQTSDLQLLDRLRGR